MVLVNTLHMHLVGVPHFHEQWIHVRTRCSGMLVAQAFPLQQCSTECELVRYGMAVAPPQARISDLYIADGEQRIGWRPISMPHNPKNVLRVRD